MKNVFGIILISLLASGAIAGLVLLTRSSNSERYSVSSVTPVEVIVTPEDPDTNDDEIVEAEIDTVHYIQF